MLREDVELYLGCEHLEEGMCPECVRECVSSAYDRALGCVDGVKWLRTETYVEIRGRIEALKEQL